MLALVFTALIINAEAFASKSRDGVSERKLYGYHMHFQMMLKSCQDDCDSSPVVPDGPCGEWCAEHEKPWDVKCAGFQFCLGCPECAAPAEDVQTCKDRCNCKIYECDAPCSDCSMDTNPMFCPECTQKEACEEQCNQTYV